MKVVFIKGWVKKEENWAPIAQWTTLFQPPKGLKEGYGCAGCYKLETYLGGILDTETNWSFCPSPPVE